MCSPDGMEEAVCAMVEAGVDLTENEMWQALHAAAPILRNQEHQRLKEALEAKWRAHGALSFAQIEAVLDTLHPSGETPRADLSDEDHSALEILEEAGGLHPSGERGGETLRALILEAISAWENDEDFGLETDAERKFECDADFLEYIAEQARRTTPATDSSKEER